MTKNFEQKLKDWEEIHDLFVQRRYERGEKADELVKWYHQKARVYEKKYGEYANPLQRPR